MIEIAGCNRRWRHRRPAPDTPDTPRTAGNKGKPGKARRLDSRVRKGKLALPVKR
jgi:hypothetical protein